MQVRCDEGVAIHIGPKPCACAREGAGEASAGEGELDTLPGKSGQFRVINLVAHCSDIHRETNAKASDEIVRLSQSTPSGWAHPGASPPPSPAERRRAADENRWTSG